MAKASYPPGATPLLVLTLALLAPQRLAAAEPRQLSDAELIAYDAQPFDHAAMMGKRVVVGLFHGARVVAEFPCSDVCPDYTTRIVHLDVAPGAACAAAGGVTEARRVPCSIAMVERDFCVPRPLARAGH
ncbi:MAG TPA: hypothetical protein VKQ70_03920 [Caulobacteraceae bacterium]|nr:hypothetical protein [Caulobacteraceae bacterium]